MIVGIGTDIVSVPRIKRLIAQYGDRLAVRILCGEELHDYYKIEHREHFLAKRFAAKEAAVKALGTGFRLGIGKRDIEVGHDAMGRPEVIFHGQAHREARKKNVAHAWLSISDEREYAVAVVIVETR